MTRRSPADPAFNKALWAATDDPGHQERVMFFDTDNQIREAVYPSEFNTGLLCRVRERLESAGVLKAVVHVSALAMGKHGPATTLIEYLPDGRWYAQHVPPRVSRHWDSPDEEAIQKTKELFDNGEEGAQQEPPD